MIPVRNARLRGAILATAFASSMAVAPVASATETVNKADLDILGGDAVAVSKCVNFAKDWTSYDDKEKKKKEKKRLAQANWCDNFAFADGGDVDLKNVDIKFTPKGKKKDARNDVSLTIAGGDATAVAACLNVLQGTADKVDQENDCKNSAVAEGGDVTLKNVKIIFA